jgi:hypothetical protein
MISIIDDLPAIDVAEGTSSKELNRPERFTATWGSRARFEPPGTGC